MAATGEAERRRPATSCSRRRRKSIGISPFPARSEWRAIRAAARRLRNVAGGDSVAGGSAASSVEARPAGEAGS
jgi:hypothetical protein